MSCRRCRCVIVDADGNPLAGSGSASDPYQLAAPVMVVIAQSVLGAPAASFDFQSIPATYEDLRLVIEGRGDTAAGSVDALIRFNNDSGANYDRVWSFAYASTTGAQELLAQTSSLAAVLPAAAASNAAQTGHGDVLIPAYARTARRKGFSSTGGFQNTDASGGTLTGVIIGMWRSAAAINRVTVTASAGNFVAGSVATLYGIKGS